MTAFLLMYFSSTDSVASRMELQRTLKMNRGSFMSSIVYQRRSVELKFYLQNLALAEVRCSTYLRTLGTILADFACMKIFTQLAEAIAVKATKWHRNSYGIHIHTILYLSPRIQNIDLERLSAFSSTSEVLAGNRPQRNLTLTTQFSSILK